MKTLSILLFFTVLGMSASCDRKLIRPKGSDIEYQQRQEEAQRLDQQQKHEVINQKDFDPEAARGFESY